MLIPMTQGSHQVRSAYVIDEIDGHNNSALLFTGCETVLRQHSNSKENAPKL